MWQCGRHRLIELPDSLRNKAVSLSEIGVSELAWSYPAILEVINYVANNGHLLLGGDVYATNGQTLTVTLDGWYLDTRRKVSANDMVGEGRKLAREFVETYHSRNGGCFLYSVVIAGMDTLRSST